MGREADRVMTVRSPQPAAPRAESPRRVVAFATLAIFWATLLLALGFPGAGPILVAALGGSAMVVVRRLLAGVRVPELPRVPVRSRLTQGLAAVDRARRGIRLPEVSLPEISLPRPPSLPAGSGERARAAAASLRSRRPQPRRRRVPEAPRAAPGRAGEAWEFCRLGAQLRHQGRLAAAVESFETAVWMFRDLDEPRGLALALNGLGLALVRQRKLDEAVVAYREAGDLLERLGDRHAHGQVLANLGTALRTQGRSAEARASWEDALAHLEPGSAEYDRIRELRAVG
jgi:tetratricopeptide (TPR) repeat protein